MFVVKLFCPFCCPFLLSIVAHLALGFVIEGRAVSSCTRIIIQFGWLDCSRVVVCVCACVRACVRACDFVGSNFLNVMLSVFQGDEAS